MQVQLKQLRELEMSFDLSKHIIGCRQCLGEWVYAGKVKRAVKEFKQTMKERREEHESNYANDLIDSIFGKELI